MSTFDDFNILAAHFGGTVAPWQLGDATGDGIVNLNDFNCLASNFGMTASGTGAPSAGDWARLGAAVPEPGMMSFLTSLGLITTRRRR